MATGYLLPISTILQFFTDQGVVLAGGKIYTYVAGTTTPVATYTSSSLSVAQANPIILQSNGRLGSPVWVPTGVTVKMVLQDSSGNTISGGTIDNLQGINDPSYLTANGIGLALYPQTAAELAASITPTNYAYPTGNVLRYGAVGNGIANDSTAFSNAYSSYGSITIPPATYNLSSNISISTLPASINGVTAGSSIKTSGFVLSCSNTYLGNISNLFMTGSGTSSGNGLSVSYAHKVKIDSVFASNYQYGGLFTYSFLNTLVNSDFSNCYYGAKLINNCNSFSALSASFNNNTSHGLWVLSSQKLSFYGCDFENNGGWGIYLDNSDNATLQLTTFKCDSGYFENNTLGDVYVGSNTSATLVTGCVFTNSAHFGGKPYGYYVDRAVNTKIIDPDFTSATFTTSAIYLSANSQNTKIVPFISSQVTAASGATVSSDTIQSGTVSVTLDGSGNSSGSVTFPVQYYQIPQVILTVYSNSAPAHSLGNIAINNGIGTTGFFWQLFAGPPSGTVVVQWRAGN